jgi:hypothetical protein
MKETFTHMVFFWMKEPDNKDHQTKFEASLARFINGSPQVISQHIGRPAGTERTVVDNSYQYCLVVTFASKEDHDIYQDDPAHHEFIDECKDLWDRVQVYDSVKIS